MIKFIKFLCIAGIILLLGLFVSYTESGYNNEKEEISENKEESVPEELATEVGQNKSDTNINLSQKVIKLIFF